MTKPLQKHVTIFGRTISAADIIPDNLLDILTRFVRSTARTRSEDTDVDRTTEIFRVSRNDETYEVTVDSDITLDDYRRITPAADWKLLERYAERFRGKSTVFINPTMEGGGVAMLRPPLVHLMRQLGIDAHWYVMAGRLNPDDPNPFVFTKLMHNISQRRTAPDVRIDEDGKRIHQEWNRENAAVLTKQNTIRYADVIVLDDPQPAPLKKHIDAVNPHVRWVWRNHIDTDGDLMADPSTPQGEVASYLLDECDIRSVHAVVTHPVEQFVHPTLSSKTYFAPATIEPHDDLNRPLSSREIREGVRFINAEIQRQNHVFSHTGREDDVQAAVDPGRRKIALVARFDESKGMDKAMEIGARVYRSMRTLGYEGRQLPQIIIIGNGSVDDPSGLPMYDEMLRLRREQYPDEKDDIIVMRLRHNYKAMNALMYPTPSRSGVRSPQLVALQTSEAEGCETRISDWIRHGVPVVVANRGGMPLQVVEDKSGFVLDYDKSDFDLDRGAEIIVDLMTSHDTYAVMRKSTLEQAESFNNREFTTTANATRFLRICCRLHDNLSADRAWKIDDLVKIEEINR